MRTATYDTKSLQKFPKLRFLASILKLTDQIVRMLNILMERLNGKIKSSDKNTLHLTPNSQCLINTENHLLKTYTNLVKT